MSEYESYDSDSDMMFDLDYSLDSDDEDVLMYGDSDDFSQSSSDSSDAESSSREIEMVDPVPHPAENQQPTEFVAIQQHAESAVTQSSADSLATRQVPETPTVSNTNNESVLTEDDAFSCPICLEGLTNTGPHKPACLKCGHIFGINCLERWIKVGCNSDARRCPTCNTKASLKDIRLLYAKKLVAIDTAVLTSLEAKLTEERRENSVMKTEIEKCKVKHEFLINEVQRLKSDVEEMVSRQPSTSGGPTTNRSCIKKINISKNPGCRVLAFNKNSMLLVASQNSESPLFNPHVIRKVNASILELSKECIYAHKKPIRDMAFHPIEHNLLASVGLDKCVNLVDFTSNNIVASIEVTDPLWSCCWAGNNSNILVAGGQSGSLFYIDKRFMKLLDYNNTRTPACVSLVSLPPSNSRSFINGGFLRTRLDFLSVFEQNSGSEIVYKESELPLKGFWTSTSYDSNANLMLSTSKPCGNNKSLRHIVSRISNFDEEGPSVQPVVTFYGGTKATHLSRSCIIPSNQPNEDTLVCCNDEISSTVKLFSINSGKNVHSFQVKESFLDLCPLDGVLMNGGRRTVAGLSDNALSIFSV